MLEKRRVFVSDVHMNAGRSIARENVYDWLGPDEAHEFAQFLTYVNDDENIGEVIFLGDTMDNWVCPVEDNPPSFQEIIDATVNKVIVSNLKTLCSNKKKRVVYMTGNHDMHVTEDLLSANFPGIVFGGSAANKSRYRSSRLLAEHGSSYAMFNAPDPANDAGTRTPLGYYISRVLATKAANTGQTERHYWTYVDDFLELLGPEKIAGAVFEAVMEEAGLLYSTKINMGGYQTDCGSIKAKYNDLYRQWVELQGAGMAFKAVMAEISYLDDLADYLTKKGDTNIVIFGHSHDAKIDKDSWFVENRIYANCGSWCEDDKPKTYVETQKDNGKHRHYVRLMEYKNGKGVEIKSESVDL